MEWRSGWRCCTCYQAEAEKTRSPEARSMNKEMTLTGAKIVDPVSGYFGRADIHIADGRIARVDKRKKKPAGKSAINLKGLYLCPGFIDMHVHLREPGREDEETIISGAEAAVAG